MLQRIIDRDLLSSEKKYTMEDIIDLAKMSDETYEQVIHENLLKDFTANDAKLILDNIDFDKRQDLLKYRHLVTAHTMIDLNSFSQLRELFEKYPQIQQLGPLGSNAINEIINANDSRIVSSERKVVHDFGRDLCADVQSGKLNKYDCGKLYANTETVNLELVRELYQNMAKYNLQIKSIKYGTRV